MSAKLIFTAAKQARRRALAEERAQNAPLDARSDAELETNDDIRKRIEMLNKRLVSMDRRTQLPVKSVQTQVPPQTKKVKSVTPQTQRPAQRQSKGFTAEIVEALGPSELREAVCHPCGMLASLFILVILVS